ncbi:MAG: hypothetical protein MJK18_10920, partial [Bdellovibrionales bacterium]|nr:hypothetical protein [Bdellovibrionales bacterium]
MNNWIIMMISALTLMFSVFASAEDKVVTPESLNNPVLGNMKAKYTVAQSDEEEEEAEQVDFFDGDEIEPVSDEEAEAQEEEVAEEGGEADDVDARPKARSRFNRKSRFNRNNNRNNNRASRSNNRPTIAPRNNRPTTPVKDIKLEKASTSKGGKKMSFAEAQPEDITNENFPDIIESFDYP